jgi:hypothetical protein
MSSTDPYGTRPFNRNDPLKASQLESMRQGNQGNVQIRNPDNYVRRLPGGHILTEKRRRSEGGSALIWLTTINTGLSLLKGAEYDFPGGTATGFTNDNVFYISTPWNTRIIAPANFFGYFVQDDKTWYHEIQKFYIKPSMNYPSGAAAGITTFTCYLNRDDASLNLGINTAFPTGIKAILSGFDNVNAGTTSLNYFNGKVFEASFDAAANIIYFDHPTF